MCSLHTTWPHDETQNGICSCWLSIVKSLQQTSHAIKSVKACWDEREVGIDIESESGSGDEAAAGRPEGRTASEVRGEGIPECVSD